MDAPVNVAVVGATGAVGEMLLEILNERSFPVDRLYALASERSAGNTVLFRKRAVDVERLEGFDFSKVDIAFFSAGGSVSAEFAPRAVEQGCVVIDNTSHFRNDDHIPLVVPEVNSHALANHSGIIANPNCSTIQMVVALKPLYDAVGLRRVTVSTYQAVSGAGKRAIEELAGQTAALLNGQSAKPGIHLKQIAFNALPAIGPLQDNGYTHEEMKMVWETHKILEDKTIEVNPTAVRIPVFYGHSEAVYVETRAPISAKEARLLLQAAPGVVVIDEAEPFDFPTPVTAGAGTDGVYVGRIRGDLSCDNGLNLWVVSDNIRKGAALNSVQIAEHLMSGG